MAFSPIISTIGWYLPPVVFRQPDRGDRDEPAQYRPPASAVADPAGHVPGGSILLIYCMLTIVGTLISDILLALFDPRIRMEGT